MKYEVQTFDIVLAPALNSIQNIIPQSEAMIDDTLTLS